MCAASTVVAAENLCKMYTKPGESWKQNSQHSTQDSIFLMHGTTARIRHHLATHPLGHRVRAAPSQDKASPGDPSPHKGPIRIPPHKTQDLAVALHGPDLGLAWALPRPGLAWPTSALQLGPFCVRKTPRPCVCLGGTYACLGNPPSRVLLSAKDAPTVCFVWVDRTPASENLHLGPFCPRKTP